jgi:arylsulfatase A-like enzyme
VKAPLLTPLSRRAFLSGLPAPLLLPARQRRPPNVVLLLTDDQGYGDLGCHGNPWVRTPNLDRLHHQSIRFTNSHVDPLCAPTRAGLMTGQYAFRNSVTAATGGWSLLRPGVPTLADVFRRNGYRTGIFGKWHLGDNYPLRPHDRGFDEAIVCRCGGVSQAADYWGNRYFDDHYYKNGSPQRFQGYCTDVFFREAAAFVNRRRNQPFFLYLPTNAPHLPYLVSERYSNPYKQRGVPSPAAEFYGMIENIDENAGRFLKMLDDLKIAENTIFIFMTDNGTSAGIHLPGQPADWQGFGAGMRAAKGSAYDGGHRTPLFIRWPAAGWRTDRDIGSLACHLDIFPTLVDLCGLKLDAGHIPDGRSLAPLLQGEPAADRTHFIQHTQITIGGKYQMEDPQPWRNAVALTDRWRLVNGKELYDMSRDPGQQHDIAAQSPEVVKEIRQRYERWWEQMSGPLHTRIRIEIGSPAEVPTGLTCFDWHGDVVPSSQEMIEQSLAGNGVWALRASRAGRYEFTLRQRPAYVPYEIQARTARLKIGDRAWSADVPAHSSGVPFRVDLPAGDLDLWTEFASAGAPRGAYYVDVQPIG